MKGTSGIVRRKRKKLLEKANWSKEKKATEGGVEENSIITRATIYPARGMESSTSKSTNPDNIRSSSVLFVEQTRRGVLAAKLREKEKQLCSITGWKLKVVEKSGTTLRQLLVKSNPWSGPKCGRKDRFPCNSTNKGDSKYFKKTHFV